MTSDSQSKSRGEWLDRINELDALIEPLATERAALKRKILESKSEFKPGDIITWNKGKRMGIVKNIIPWLYGEPMWMVVNIRKDGTEGSIYTVRPYDKPVRFNNPSSPATPAGIPETQVPEMPPHEADDSASSASL